MTSGMWRMGMAVVLASMLGAVTLPASALAVPISAAQGFGSGTDGGTPDAGAGDQAAQGDSSNQEQPTQDAAADNDQPTQGDTADEDQPTQGNIADKDQPSQDNTGHQDQPTQNVIADKDQPTQGNAGNPQQPGQGAARNIHVSDSRSSNLPMGRHKSNLLAEIRRWMANRNQVAKVETDQRAAAILPVFVITPVSAPAGEAGCDQDSLY